MILKNYKSCVKFQLLKNKELEEFSDRLSYKFTCFIYFVFGIIILYKQYFDKSISCYAATDPGGSRLIKYIESYCWVYGIIPSHSNVTIPVTEMQLKEIEKLKIVYHHWIPFILFFQGVVCFVPNIIWRMFQTTGHNKDFQHLISIANVANNLESEKRKEHVISLAKSLEKVLFQNRDVKCHSNIESRLVKLKSYLKMWKTMGVPIALFYVIIKFLYLINAFGQIAFMQYFLNLDVKLYTFFGMTILNDIINGKDWQVSMVFPRAGFCFAKLRQLAGMNYVTAQCTLPINMLNEKIYIFLWFWMVFLTVISSISLIIWIIRMLINKNKTNFVKMYLKLSGDYVVGDSSNKKLKCFQNSFLRYDGIFLLKMMASNTGDLITAEVVSQLWKIYSPKFQDVSNLDLDRIHKCLESPRLSCEHRVSI